MLSPQHPVVKSIYKINELIINLLLIIKKTIKMRKTYQKPMTEVIKLNVENQLLQASGSKSTRRGYGYGGGDTW